MNVTHNNPASQSLLMLAWRIWSAGGDPVLIEDAATRAELEPELRDGLVLEDEKGLRFASELSMVHAAAQYTLDTEGPLLTSTPKACFERLDEIVGKEIGKKDMVSGHVLALRAPGTGALLGVKVLPQVDHSERSEAQLHEGD